MTHPMVDSAGHPKPHHSAGLSFSGHIETAHRPYVPCPRPRGPLLGWRVSPDDKVQIRIGMNVDTWVGSDMIAIRRVVEATLVLLKLSDTVADMGPVDLTAVATSDDGGLWSIQIENCK